MKISNYVLLIALFLTSNVLLAQDEEQKSKFKLITTGGIGFGIVNNDDQPDYNLNSNSAEILLNYNFNESYGIATGIGFYELTGTGFDSIGNFYHQRNFLKIPLLLTMNYGFTDKIKFTGNIGGYAQVVAKDEYRYLNNTIEDRYEGWNFGLQIGFALLFELTDKFEVGVNYSGQSDFTKLESNSNSGISDEQRMKNLNTFGLILVINL